MPPSAHAGRPTFSTALLAGGRSSRMGRDKALLPMPDSGLLLWQHQWRTLEELRPSQMFWSGPLRGPLLEHAIHMPDRVSDAGPLAGIAACLDALKTDLLLVLAVDLPHMTPEYLPQILAPCDVTSGVVPHRDGRFEPLVAVYPRGLGRLAMEQLQQGNHRLQDFVAAGVKAGALLSYDASGADASLFRNLNLPSDLIPGQKLT